MVGEFVDEYLELSRVSRREEDLQNEVKRLKSSFSFRIGNLFVRAFEKPLTLPLLPIKLSSVLMKKIFTKRKKEKYIKKITRNCIVGYSAGSPRGIHFERMEAILYELRQTGIQTVHVTSDREIRAFQRTKSHALYSIPSRGQFDDMIPRTWNKKFEQIFSGVLDTFHPRTVMFDGDYPFRGFLNSISLRPEMNRFWIRESILNHKISDLPIDGFDIFDGIIHPSMKRREDPDAIIGNCGTIFCNPIVNTRPGGSSLRNLREKLASLNKKTVFVQLSRHIDNLNEIFETLISKEDLNILCQGSFVPKDYVHHKNIITSSEISTTEAIQVADACIISPDFFNIYSCFWHRKPTMCIVNTAEDINSIFREFESKNIPIILLEDQHDSIFLTNGVERLFDEEYQSQLIQRMEMIDVEDGGQILSEYIHSLHDSNQVEVGLID